MSVPADSPLGRNVTLGDGRRGRVTIAMGGSGDNPESTRIDGPSLLVAIDQPTCSTCPHRALATPPLLIHVRASEVVFDV